MALASNRPEPAFAKPINVLHPRQTACSPAAYRMKLHPTVTLTLLTPTPTPTRLQTPHDYVEVPSRRVPDCLHMLAMPSFPLPSVLSPLLHPLRHPVTPS